MKTYKIDGFDLDSVEHFPDHVDATWGVTLAETGQRIGFITSHSLAEWESGIDTAKVEATLKKALMPHRERAQIAASLAQAWEEHERYAD